MAQPPLEQFIRRTLLLKEQSAEGTPATPSNSVDGVRLYDGSSGTEVDSQTVNPDVPHFAGASMYVFNKRAFVEGMFELYAPEMPGDAVDGTPDCHPLLGAAGMVRVLNAGARTTRYNPISTGIPYTTAYWYHSDTLLRVHDARHAISSVTLEIGKRFEGRARVQGSYSEMEEAELPLVDLPEDENLVLQAHNGRAQITVLPGGSPVTLRAKSMTLDFGSDIKTKEYTGYKTTTIDGRTPKWTLRCARPAKADFDALAVRDASGYVTVTMRIKGADGRYAMMGVRGQIESVSPDNIDGDYGFNITGMCTASSAGGDEFFIEFGDVALRLAGELPDGEVGAAYTGTLTLTGEHTAPLVYSISTGTLPAGLSLNTSTGAITGTPTLDGSFTFTVRVQDANGQIATREQVVVIAP